MSLRIAEMTDTELRGLELRGLPAPAGEAGLGTLHTERGNLPLASLDLDVRIAGLTAHTELGQRFHNPYDEPLEATYVFPLPDRAAVTGMRMTADDRVIQAELAERGAARARYDEALAAGRRAAIAEQERPDVFTVRVGNILPGEQVTVALTLAGPLAYEDGEATFRFPLVVAPRYIPGAALGDGAVGDGYAPDTDAVPDASRITPPVLLPGFPYPVRLGIEVTVDTGGLSLEQARSSLPVEPAGEGRWRVRPGQRADQDFVLRMPYAGGGQALLVNPDADGDEGTFQLTVLPPAGAAPPRPRDVVLVLDRSGSMRGWKLAAARRAAARIVDTLTGADRFAVLTFDNVVERPDTLDQALVAATDRHRFRAVEHLAAVQARGGTALLPALREALGLLAGAPRTTGEQQRDRVLVLVTDGQVGNEDQILREAGADLARVRVHTVGIDRAVNAGLLGRLAAAGAGRCELVESEQRLDEAMERIHRRIGAPLVTGITLAADGLQTRPDTLTPARVPDLFTGVPLVLSGRYHAAPAGALMLEGTDSEGDPWRTRVEAATVDNPALAPVWARGHLRDLEDRYVTTGRGTAAADLERRIVATSLRFSVLCRFTAYVATDSRAVTDGAPAHRVVQPVEPASGWDMLSATPAPVAPAGYEVLALGTTEAAAALPVRPARRGWGPLTGSGRGDRPHRGRPRRAAPATTPGPDPVTDLRSEVERLRSAEDAPEQRRRELLADLASRLDALLRAWPTDADHTAAGVRELVSELRGDAVRKLSRPQLDHLWQRLRRLLEALIKATEAGQPAPPAPARGQPPARGRQGLPPARRRQGFWRQV